MLFAPLRGAAVVANFTLTVTNTGARDAEDVVLAKVATVLQKYFKKTKTGDWQISNDLRDAVEFTKCNLSDPLSARAYRQFDLIFCRNLLIYFDDVSRRSAADVFYNALNPGGFICLGHSESMSRISSVFRIRKFAEAIVYQKP